MFVVVRGYLMDLMLVDGEWVIMLKNIEINCFDIIIFLVLDELDKNYIKCVIGLFGDIIVYKDDMLYINGKEVDEFYLDEFKKVLIDG